MRLRLRIVTALALVFALAVPALAQASGSDVQKDCGDGTLTKKYSQKDYADALATMPADLDEYSDCRDQIRRAQLSGGGSGGGSATGGGGTTGGAGGGAGGATGADDGTGAYQPDPLSDATPEERAAFEKAIVAGAAPVSLDGRPVTPGTLGGAKSNGISDLPTTLLVILALLALAGLGAAAFGTQRLVNGRRAP